MYIELWWLHLDTPSLEWRCCLLACAYDVHGYHDDREYRGVHWRDLDCPDQFVEP